MTMMGPRPSMGRWANGSKLESDEWERGGGVVVGESMTSRLSTWHLEPASRRPQGRPRGKQGSWRAERARRGD